MSIDNQWLNKDILRFVEIIMKKKTLGIKKLQISNLGLGCMGMSEYYGKINDLESILNLSSEELLQIKQHIRLNFAQGDLLPESFVRFPNH